MDTTALYSTLQESMTSMLYPMAQSLIQLVIQLLPIVLPIVGAYFCITFAIDWFETVLVTSSVQETNNLFSTYENDLTDEEEEENEEFLDEYEDTFG